MGIPVLTLILMDSRPGVQEALVVTVSVSDSAHGRCAKKVSWPPTAATGSAPHAGSAPHDGHGDDNITAAHSCDAPLLDGHGYDGEQWGWMPVGLEQDMDEAAWDKLERAGVDGPGRSVPGRYHVFVLQRPAAGVTAKAEAQQQQPGSSEHHPPTGRLVIGPRRGALLWLPPDENDGGGMGDGDGSQQQQQQRLIEALAGAAPALADAFLADTGEQESIAPGASESTQIEARSRPSS